LEIHNDGWKKKYIEMFGSFMKTFNYETEKITHKASDVVQFIRPILLCTMTLLMLFSERPLIYASCMMISGGRTEQLDIIAGFLPH